MPTLQNIQGGSLVANLAPALGSLENTFERRRQQQAATAQQQTLQDRITQIFALQGQGLTGGAPAQPPIAGLPPLPTPVEPSEELTRLNQISPELGGAVTQAREKGDPQEIAALRQEVVTGGALADEISKLPDSAAKRRRLTEEGAKVAAEGGDLSRIIDLQNKSEDELDLELQRMQLSRNDAVKALDAPRPVGLINTPQQQQILAQMAASGPQGVQAVQAILELDKRARAGGPEQFEAVTDAQGNIVGQRSTTTGKVEADPRAVGAAKPTTDIGRARQDLRQGLITKQDFNKLQNAKAEFRTDTGKLIQDKQSAIELFGKDSEQVQAMDDAINAAAKGEEPKRSDIRGIRKEYTALSGDFIKMRDSIGKIKAGVANPSAAGDISLIFSFMKMNDPTSVVREGEQATAQNAAGVTDQVRNAYNRALTGERLTSTQRTDFEATAGRLFASQRKRQLELENEFRGLAELEGIDPNKVVLDFLGEDRGQNVEASPDGTIPPAVGQENIINGIRVKRVS